MKDLIGKGKPFYSALDQAAQAIKRNVGTGQEFMQELAAQPGVKQQEIQDRMLAELHGIGKMNKEQFLHHLKRKSPPKIKEKMLQAPSGDEVNAALEKSIRKRVIEQYRSEGYTRKQIDEVLPEAIEDAKRTPLWDHAWRAEYQKLNKNPPEHGKWTLPGGENYREMLIKAPPSMEQFPGVRAHFRNEPGILASMRLKDRMVPDLEGPHSVKVIGGGGTSTVKHPTREAAERFADVKRQGGYKTEITPLNHKKYLHLEELQSDWHQQGRDKGYASDYEPEAEMLKKRDELYDARTALVQQALAIEKKEGLVPQELVDQINGLNDQLRTIEERKDKARNAVPDAPFKKNWEEMALKRLVHHAAEKGYHGIVVTPGDVQADRYSLAKHVDELHYNPEIQRLIAKKEGRHLIDERSVPPEKLESFVGKDVAKKVMEQEPNSNGLRSLVGQQLVVGGEGMKGFYDKKVPNILNAIGKKHGVKTHLHGHHIETHPEQVEEQIAAPGIGHFPEPIVHPAKTVAVHHFPITEQMRQEILKNGLPLYADGGEVSAESCFFPKTKE